MKKRLFPVILSAVMILGAGAFVDSQPDIATFTASAEAATISADLTLKKDVVYNGNLYITGGTLDLDGYSLTVNGTVYQSGGVLQIGTGTAKITGNYELQNQSGIYGSGELNMFSSKGVLDVDGDVIINTTIEANHQDSGTLKIGGDLTVSNPYGGKGLQLYHNHVTEFKGGKAHIVNFENTDDYFNKIQLGIGDSLEFTGALSGIEQGSNPAIAVTPADIANVSGLTVTGIAKGEGKIAFSNGSSNISKTLIIGDVVDSDEPIVTPPVVEPTTPEVTLLGDVNEDGNFSVIDIILMQKWILNKPNTHLVNWKNGDFNNDNKLNVIDLALMKKALIKEPEIVATNFNIYTVYNQPTSPSTFTVDEDCTVYSLMTYHWNNQKGTTQTGTIGLLEDGVEIGTWTTTGTEGMYGTPNAVWWAYPKNLTLKAGHTYTIIDSDPSTWSQNGGSNGQGFFEVKGIIKK